MRTTPAACLGGRALDRAARAPAAAFFSTGPCMASLQGATVTVVTSVTRIAANRNPANCARFEDRIIKAAGSPTDRCATATAGPTARLSSPLLRNQADAASRT